MGFSGTESQESCRRCTAILLANITSRHPYLISDILALIRNNMNELEQVRKLNYIIFLFSLKTAYNNWLKEIKVSNVFLIGEIYRISLTKILLVFDFPKNSFI